MRNTIRETNKKEQTNNLEVKNKRMIRQKKTGKQVSNILVWAGILIFSIYFSVYTVLRYQRLVASYFDLGIMHQTVYNTYRAIQTFDFSRFLEMTNPHGFEQVKRMAIHNDLFLALISPLYFLHDGPSTLLVLQAVVVGLGAWAVFNISLKVFEKNSQQRLISVIFAFSYLFYPPLQRAVIYEFHAVTLSTSFLLFMYYCWSKKKYAWSLFFLFLSLLTKEHMGLTTSFFGFFILYKTINSDLFLPKKKEISEYIVSLKKKHLKAWFPLIVIGVSVVWFFISMKIIIPLARPQGGHFALDYYSDLTHFLRYIYRKDTLIYFYQLLSPVGFLSVFSLPHLLIVFPEFAINLLSTSFNMRNIIYHYTAVITPFVFISAIHGFHSIYSFISSQKNIQIKFGKDRIFVILSTLFLIGLLFVSYLEGPLPYAKKKDIYAFTHVPQTLPAIKKLSKELSDEYIKISSTGHFAPYFTSRRYFYNFSDYYVQADYVIVSINEAKKGWQKEIMATAYDKLRSDQDFFLVYKHNDLEVYKKIIKLQE